jgi:O-antigen/teichoic acid export membrane protein
VTEAPPNQVDVADGRTVAGNAAANAAGQIFGKLSTLAWVVVAARQLTRGDFGAFSLALSIALLVSVVAEWGFDVVLVRRVTAARSQAGRLLALAVTAQLLVGLPVFGVTAIVEVAARRDAGSTAMFLLVLAAIYLELWTDSSRALAAALHMQGRAAVALVVQRAVSAGMIITALVLGWGLTGLGVTFLLGSVVGWFTHQVAVHRMGVRLQFRPFRLGELREFAHGAAVFGVNAIVLIALARLDAIFLSALKGDDALGSYATAYRLFETTLFLTFAVASSVLPSMSARPEPRRVGGLFVGSMNAVLVAYVPFAVVCLVDAPGVLELFFGERYADTATGALQWLALSPTAFATAYLAVVALTALHRTRSLLVASVSATALNAGLNLLLIPRYSGSGAGAANTLAYALQGAILVVMLVRHSGRLSLLDAVGEPVVAGCVFAVFLIAVPAPVLVEVGTGLLLYAVTWIAVVRWRRPDRLRFLVQLFRRPEPGAVA